MSRFVVYETTVPKRQPKEKYVKSYKYCTSFNNDNNLYHTLSFEVSLVPCTCIVFIIWYYICTISPLIPLEIIQSLFDIKIHYILKW